MKTQQDPLFAKNPINRMDGIRHSIDTFFTASAIPPTGIILIANDELILKDNETDYFFSPAELAALGISTDRLIFLGVKESIYYFVKSTDQIPNDKFKRTNLRAFADKNLNAVVDGMGLLAQAFSIVKWHETHQYCPTCGTKTNFAYGGWRQDCPACSREHFPRIDPVVIMLVTNGDYCLLGSSKNFPLQRYSCLAGFIEPGETIEDAARRELFEEAGVIGTEVNYISSQPWPFPFSLMIGVHVVAEEMVLDVNYNELSDARWVSKSEIIAVLNGATDRGFTLPSRVAIARILLEAWVAI